MSETQPPADTVTLTIDGEQITVPKGTLIIRAAEQLGTIVPRFCDHPLLDPVGACRQCMVEIEGGPPKPMMACTTPVGDDMVVKTHRTSEMARKGQEGTLEFLLINHPLDCPMCDKGGECPLQDQALTYGTNTSRFVDQKRRYLKPVAISEQILLDRERCVLCARCTRFAEQISGEPFIELFERSALEQVAIYEDEPYHSYFSGNIIQICPVGALTSTDYRFRARPFDVVTAPSVCDHCSAGCTLTVQARRGDIQRQLARTNMPVNEAWNCDKGRFAYSHLASSQRLTTPHVRGAGGLEPTSWADAMVRANEALTASRREHGRARAAVLTGSRLADEDAYAAAKYARRVLGTDDVDFRTRFASAGETGELAAVQPRETATYAQVEAAPVTVVAGLDPAEEVPILFLRLRKAWRNHKARLVVVGPRLGSLAEYAWRRVATAPGEEAAELRGLARALDASSNGTEVAAALRDADAPVVLVGERAGAGTLTAAAELAAAAGGTYAWVPRRAGARGGLQAGLAPGLLPGGRRLDDADDRAEVEAEWGPLPEEPGRDLHGVLTEAAAGRIDVLHLIGVDLLRDCDSPALAARALARVSTVVAQDLAMNETVAEHADVVLPATGTQERHGSMTDWEGRTQRFAKAVDGPELVLDDWEILQQLAALQGHDLGFNDLAGLRREQERLGRRAQAHAWPQAGAEEAGGDAAADEGDGDDGDDGSLALVSAHLLLDRGTMLADAANLLATAKEPWVGLNARDAERLGIADGATVEVSGPGGSLRLPARVGGDVVPGAVFVPANSTETPAAALGGEEGTARVTVAAVEDAEVGA